MKLLDYLRTNQITDDQFAVLVGRSKWAVRKWMYSQRIPRAGEMQLIAQATNGAVTANDFMVGASAPSTTEAAA